jgi:hypothetical protein
MRPSHGRFPARAAAARVTLFWLALSATAGCGSSREARVVYRDGEGGVIGVPKNSNSWPHYYRRQAERVMARHFPKEGYLVVREVEVTRGQTTTFDGLTESGQAGGTGRVVSLFGKRASNHGEQSLKQLTETHIFYVKNDPVSQTASGGFAKAHTYTPIAYDGPVSPRLADVVKADGRDAEKREIVASYTGLAPSAWPETSHSSPSNPKAVAPPEVPSFKPIEAPSYVPDPKPDDWLKTEPAAETKKSRSLFSKKNAGS